MNHSFTIPPWDPTLPRVTTIRLTMRLEEHPNHQPRPWLIRGDGPAGGPLHGGRDWHVLWFRTPNEAKAYLRRYHGVTVE